MVPVLPSTPAAMAAYKGYGIANLVLIAAMLVVVFGPLRGHQLGRWIAIGLFIATSIGLRVNLARQLRQK